MNKNQLIQYANSDVLNKMEKNAITI